MSRNLLETGTMRSASERHRERPRERDGESERGGFGTLKDSSFLLPRSSPSPSLSLTHRASPLNWNNPTARRAWSSR